jgi:uncharacterized YigZ family protein
MEDSYRTLEKPAEGLFRDRNSRFMAFGYPVESADQANEILNVVRKKYHDARHHCYAFRLGYEKEISRMNDDGEPSGTAGKPIYNQLISNNLTNTMIIVVRYFGGTLLGTGGLINAYRSATTDMLNNASIILRYVEEQIRLTFPFEKLNAVMKLLKDENCVPQNPVYESNCVMVVGIRKSLSERLMQKLRIIGGIHIESL